MWSTSFVILVIGAFLCVAQSDDNVEPEKCNGPPPLRMNPDGCCKKPIFKPDFRTCMNKTRQIILQRFREGNAEENNEETAAKGADEACLANCFSSNDIFQNGNINRDELIKVLESETDDIDWLPIHSIVVDKCIEVLKPEFEKMENTKWVKKCNRMAVRMLLCLNGQYFVNCPETHFQNDNANCKEFQEHIKTCPMPRGGPWNHGNGRRGFGKGPGKNGFGPNFGPPPNFRSNYGSGANFGEGPHHFGPGPNFGTGQVFGFL